MTNNKPLPKDHPLHHAHKEIIAAVTFYEKMHKHHIGDFANFDTAWREFLQKVERVWNKTQAAVSAYPKWKRVESDIVRLRNSDPLLQYLRHARNADEHGIQPVADEWNANLRATALDGAVRLDWSPYDRPLLPVRNRGVRYEPPRVHLGIDFSDRLGKGLSEALIVADLALHFYRDVLNRVLNEVLPASTLRHTV